MAQAQVMLVTGATDGIGREVALELARRGARVLVHGRDPGKVKAVVQEVRRAGSEGTEGLVADFASLEEVRRLAREVEAKTDRLDVLINNAGIYMEERVLSEDGYELTFQVNHLAPFLLTELLVPLLKRSAPSRVVTVSSVAHQRGELDFENLNAERYFDAYGAYALSKLANVLFTFELAERLAGSGVTANCLHPGVIDTKLLRDGFGSLGASVQHGASTPVYLATSPEVAEVSGRYFVRNQVAQTFPEATDPRLRKRLWEVSAHMTGLALR